MAVTILIPTALRAFTDRKAEVEIEGRTAGEAIAAFAGFYPDIRRHLYDDDGSLRSFINIYVGEKNVKDASGLETPVQDGETVMIVPAIAGGTSPAPDCGACPDDWGLRP
ncbi:MAG: MoaD/ThiS family protein [Desulfovibrio sp.]|jgi:molybdopterin converting factor small subunit|nr:MoaD/ThiS family protein [Desulfovibrio sp.]